MQDLTGFPIASAAPGGANGGANGGLGVDMSHGVDPGGGGGQLSSLGLGDGADYFDSLLAGVPEVGFVDDLLAR